MITRKITMRVISICLALIVSVAFLPTLANGSITTEPVVDFGDVVKDSSKTITLKITNKTDEPMGLRITWSSDGSCAFSLSSSILSMEGRETVDVGLSYEARSLGPCEGKLFIMYEVKPTSRTTSSTGTTTSGTVIVTLMGNGVEEDEPTILIDGCGTGVPDRDYNGSSISELIEGCANGARNHGDHGAYVNGVARLTNELKKEGVISGEEKGAIQRCAAQANIP
ncbi:MAG: hypothetical protein ACETWD_10255 [Desulfatiglandales bacterium]